MKLMFRNILSKYGIMRVWEDDFEIKVKIQNNTQANSAGLISLAYHLLTLSQCKAGSHFHYDDCNSLEEGSCELIVEKIDSN